MALLVCDWPIKNHLAKLLEIWKEEHIMIWKVLYKVFSKQNNKRVTGSAH
jgi:hypothetical protein